MATSKLGIIIEARGADGTVHKLQQVANKAKAVGGATSSAGKKVRAFGKEGLISGNSMKNLAGSIAIVQGPLGPVSGRISALGAVMGRLNVSALAATAGVTALGVIFTKVLSVTKDYESQMGKLNAIIKATGGSAGISADQIDRFAVKLGEDTLASAKGVREAAGALLSFRSISGDTFKKTLVLAQDLAATFGGSLKDKTVQLAKALDDPKRGLDALRRSGVLFTAEQKKEIKALVDKGEKLKAQKIILEEVNKQVGGAGVGAAKGLAGAIDTLSERWDNLFITIGNSSGLMKEVTDFINLLSRGVKNVNNAILSSDAVKRLERIDSLKRRIEKLKKPDLNTTSAVSSFNAESKAIQGLGKALKGATFDFSSLSQAGATADSEFDKSIGKMSKRKRLIASLELELKKAIDAATNKTTKPGNTNNTKTVDEEAIKREKSKLARLAEANAKFHDSLAIQADKAFADESQKEDIRNAAELEKIKAQRDAIVNNALATAAQKAEAEKNFIDNSDAEAEIHSANQIAIALKTAEEIGAADEKNVSRLTSLADQHANFLAQITEQNDLFGASSSEAEQIRFDAETERRAEKFTKEIEDLQNHGQDISAIADSFAKEEEKREKLHGKKMNGLKKLEFKDKLAIAGEALGNLGSLMSTKSRTLFEIGKVAAIASTIVSTISSAMAALDPVHGLGPIYGIPLAASIAVAGAASVAQIASTKFNSGGSAGRVSVSAQGGAGGGIGGGEATPQPIQQRPATQITIINQGNVLTSDFTANQIMPHLKDLIGNGDHIIIQPGSAQHQVLTA